MDRVRGMRLRGKRNFANVSSLSNFKSNSNCGCMYVYVYCIHYTQAKDCRVYGECQFLYPSLDISLCMNRVGEGERGEKRRDKRRRIIIHKYDYNVLLAGWLVGQLVSRNEPAQNFSPGGIHFILSQFNTNILQNRTEQGRPTWESFVLFWILKSQPLSNGSSLSTIHSCMVWYGLVYWCMYACTSTNTNTNTHATTNTKIRSKIPTSNPTALSIFYFVFLKQSVVCSLQSVDCTFTHVSSIQYLASWYGEWRMEKTYFESWDILRVKVNGKW